MPTRAPAVDNIIDLGGSSDQPTTTNDRQQQPTTASGSGIKVLRVHEHCVECIVSCLLFMNESGIECKLSCVYVIERWRFSISHVLDHNLVLTLCCFLLFVSEEFIHERKTQQNITNITYIVYCGMAL